jgi:hypothetical protein
LNGDYHFSGVRATPFLGGKDRDKIAFREHGIPLIEAEADFTQAGGIKPISNDPDSNSSGSDAGNSDAALHNNIDHSLGEDDQLEMADWIHNMILTRVRDE